MWLSENHFFFLLNSRLLKPRSRTWWSHGTSWLWLFTLDLGMARAYLLGVDASGILKVIPLHLMFSETLHSLLLQMSMPFTLSDWKSSITFLKSRNRLCLSTQNFYWLKVWEGNINTSNNWKILEFFILF